LGTCAHKITPMRWNDLEATRRSQNLETETFDAAHRFGLRDGLAVPVHHAADGYSVFNVATDLSPMDANSLFDRFQHTLHAIALMLYDFLNRCAAKHIFDLPQSRLNRYDIGDIVGYAGDLS
ncbi:MAG: autoinducer binding domain-containing protein, partial [Methyloligellaceae bacterium]